LLEGLAPAPIVASERSTATAAWTWFKSRIPLGRFQTPKDSGEMAAFLASDRAENITGAAFNVDGGWEMH
jgi:NAD(P)-dependent dehydrogenase (short-subunit alcohol dehydrogenase family)